MPQNISHAVMNQRHEAHDSLDDFPTPPWAVRALCEYVLPTKVLKSLTCWEPACNRGYMARPLREYFHEVLATDIHNYGWDGQERVADFLFERPQADSHDVNAIITNPPFRLAAQFAFHALTVWKPDISALLVRTNFLEGKERFETLFTPHPPATVAQFVERVPMVKGRYDQDASTATSYAWIVWKRGWSSGTKFQWIPPCRRQLQKASDSQPTMT
jgi:hypothetical protein